MRVLFIVVVLGGLLGLPASPVRAESQAVLSLESAATTLKTGESYDVDIRLDDAAEVWLADIEIQYDPALVYVMGTTSGQPIQPGALFVRDASVVVRNEVSGDRILYTISMLAPADPIRGSGVVGSFRIYPLAPGTTRILFRGAALQKAIFTQRKGRRVGVGSEGVPVTAVSLELTITGTPFEPPPDDTLLIGTGEGIKGVPLRAQQRESLIASGEGRR